MNVITPGRDDVELNEQWTLPVQLWREEISQKNLLNENVENRREETNVIGILIFKLPTKLTNNSCHESALFAMFRVI